MTISFYMDQHVPLAITKGLRQRNVDVLTVHEDNASDWTDERLLERATELGRVVFTQDDDFLAIANRWLKESREFSGVVYAHQLNVTIGLAVRDLELMSLVLAPEEMRNLIEFIPISS